MQLEPTSFNRVSNAGAELWARGVAAIFREERRVDLLDVNAAVLDRLDALSEFNELARRGLRI